MLKKYEKLLSAAGEAQEKAYAPYCEKECLQ